MRKIRTNIPLHFPLHFFFETFASSRPFIRTHHQTIKHQDRGNIL